MLLRAWAAASSTLPDWTLRLVGPSERGFGEDMERLAKALRLERIEFAGPLTGVRKWREYDAADLFVLPTHSENFGIVVAEALASGVPVITTTAAPWRGLEAERCGWWIRDDVDALAATLKSACSLSSDRLREMGTRGKTWMQRAYSWPAVGREILAVYEWLTHGGEMPASVRPSVPAD
jgi:glycosyltransferase involved in cell wall biosynthesis